MLFRANGPGESYSDVILRLVEQEAGGRRALAPKLET
jgi:hypothetical protein